MSRGLISAEGAGAADLELHLLGLLGVHGLDVLVVSERVAAVLLLRGHVPLQGLQHVLRLGTEQGLGLGAPVGTEQG